MFSLFFTLKLVGLKILLWPKELINAALIIKLVDLYILFLRQFFLISVCYSLAVHQFSGIGEWCRTRAQQRQITESNFLNPLLLNLLLHFLWICDFFLEHGRVMIQICRRLHGLCKGRVGCKFWGQKPKIGL